MKKDEVWKDKKTQELTLLLKLWEDFICVLKQESKEPISRIIALKELKKSYTPTNISIGNFLIAAVKKYGSSAKAVELIKAVDQSQEEPKKVTKRKGTKS